MSTDNSADIVKKEIVDDPRFNLIQNKEKKYALANIVNAIGEVIFSENLENFSGSYKQEVSLIAYSKGIYFLKVKTNIGIITKKLILH